MITAPYNFVPLNDKVFYPSWDKDVSHDIPFSDGESGEITIEIEAKSPIFIRNHYQEGDDFYEVEDKKTKKKIKISTEFCSRINSDGERKFYIPGSSIKGMIRNILEIMSFAKIPIDEENHKKTLSVRDMTNRRELVGQANGCGFLVKTDNGYKIKDCGKILTISYKEIQNATGVWLKPIENAVEKYQKISNTSIKFKKVKKTMNVRGRTIPKEVAIYDASSNLAGELVFTNKINNKKNEFVFYPNGQTLTIAKEVVKDFKQVYFEDEDSILGQYWKGKNKIPIFYTANKNGKITASKITAIGLTQIFKLAYNKTILEAAKQQTKPNRYDLAQTIFGYVDGKNALKGRVYFSHLKSTTIRYEPKQKEEVLGSPKPTYYPNYIKQTDTNGNKVNKYITLMDKNAKIAGWKQYPLQQTLQSNKSNDNDNITTKFKPLDSGTRFEGKIRFHNLKKAEIGALLSALTFHNQETTHFHNIGMAKPLGYGKIKITLSDFKNLKYTKEEYLKEFENLMDSWSEKTYKKWIDSIQIQNLFAYQDNTKAKPLSYQKLKNDRGKNEFIEAKKAKEFLKPAIADNKTNSNISVNNLLNHFKNR